MKQINGFAGGEDDVGRFGLGGAKKYMKHIGEEAEIFGRVGVYEVASVLWFHVLPSLSRRNDKTRF